MIVFNKRNFTSQIELQIGAILHHKQNYKFEIVFSTVSRGSQVIEVKEHIRPDGSNPFGIWFNTLDNQAAIKVAVARNILEQGNFSHVKWLNGIGEFKIEAKGAEYRIYLAKDSNNLITLLYGEPRKSSDRRLTKLLNYMKNTKKTKKKEIPLAIDSAATIISRIQQNKEFAQGLYDEAIALFLDGEAITSRLLLRDLVNATIGFEQLAIKTAKPSKSLHRMLSVNGNPTMDNLALIFKIVGEEIKPA